MFGEAGERCLDFKTIRATASEIATTKDRTAASHPAKWRSPTLWRGLRAPRG
jgi:hypothetical protein